MVSNVRNQGRIGGKGGGVKKCPRLRAGCAIIVFGSLRGLKSDLDIVPGTKGIIGAHPTPAGAILVNIDRSIVLKINSIRHLSSTLIRTRDFPADHGGLIGAGLPEGGFEGCPFVVALESLFGVDIGIRPVIVAQQANLSVLEINA